MRPSNLSKSVIVAVSIAAGSFVPSVSASRVTDAYAVVAVERRPSFREHAVAKLEAEGGGLATVLRESNVVTARSYAAGRAGSPFLFFTTGPVLVRPMLGAANLLVGAGAAGLGLVSAPFDDGELLLAGLDGVLFSLPELAFMNVRKGSYTLVPRDWALWDG